MLERRYFVCEDWIRDSLQLVVDSLYRSLRVSLFFFFFFPPFPYIIVVGITIYEHSPWRKGKAFDFVIAFEEISLFFLLLQVVEEYKYTTIWITSNGT